ncbi:hypothetical protein [Cupriavidus gilardii]|uniref:hypothetical protein n=1 Tax=Cupriavidus gilardii TaxID=82541 RepID=UPI0021B2E239|nr:hypothetical protein [Cupriavidus gilardii]UXC37341.1 hypothetical protein N4G38_07865 [Cupriavidus gilardii]
MTEEQQALLTELIEGQRQLIVTMGELAKAIALLVTSMADGVGEEMPSYRGLDG